MELDAALLNTLHYKVQIKGKNPEKITKVSNFTFNRVIGRLGRVFANGPGDLGSIPSRLLPKTLKMVLNTSLLNTQQYKVRIKGKMEQSRERSSALPNSSV